MGRLTGWRAIRSSSWAILLGAALLGYLATIDVVGGPFERALEPLRFGVHGHAASGRVALVEMDPDSAAAIRRWPWPRRNYAVVIDRLRAAGAASIVFDVDLSAPFDPADDATMAAALARSEGLVALPTFGQQAAAHDRRQLDALPLPAFREHVALASVSIQPDVDGLVRAMPFATVTAGTPRPSLSAFIAARPGFANADFPIDFSIDPASIPRLSFVAVRDGRFDPAAVRGRNILIGATAIEMGDRYATTWQGVLPGVVVQALAAETLLDRVPSRGSGLLVIALSLLLATAIVRARGAAAIAAALAGTATALTAAVLLAQHGLAVHYPLAAGLAVLFGAAVPCFARHVAGRFRLERLFDATTGLPNQHAFLAASTAGEVAVVQINNLDALLAVLGPIDLAHAVTRTAERLRLASADATVFRVRSHHLALVLTGDQPVADTLAGLRAVLMGPVEVGGRPIDVAVAIGVAGEGDRARRLTDAALAADAASRDGVFWRRASISHDTLERSVRLMGELDAAIAAGQIGVFYQPKLSLNKNRITSVEALVRWFHPERGTVPPDVFIPLAEQTDRIEPLTLHVLATVLRDAARWRAAGHRVSAAVNISARLLSSAPFNAAVDRLLAEAAVPAEALIFEVTESATLSDPASAVAALQGYRARGIAVSMDDYGTGQSTLTYLRQLPLSELKIDRSFVQFAHERSADALLVGSTIELAHQLGLTVVAEGIENGACLEFLRAQGCDMAQGYHISRPVALADLLALLQADDQPARRAG